MIKCAILSPVYNDWRSFRRLVQAINASNLPNGYDVEIVAVDDGSVHEESQDRVVQSDLPRIRRLTIVRLSCNLGHQRAIAIGLAHIERLARHDFVIVMDSDGEDRPEDLSALIDARKSKPGSIIVGQRTKRSEGTFFRSFYQIYKGCFNLITGRKVDFGNFCLIPSEHLSRIVHMSELWNHLAATIIRSKIPYTRVETRRGIRYFGRSSMDFVSLTTHGLSSMSAFSDVLFVRLLLGSSVVVCLGFLTALCVLIIRLFTKLAIPGWTTEIFGIAAVIVLQGFTLSITAAFMTLSNRTNLLFIPAINGPFFIDKIDELKINDE